MNRVTSKDGTSIAYDKSGEGKPVILVDGAMCSRLFGPMGPLSTLLAPDFEVYIYDRRGRGDSTDTKPYSIDREIEDIEALINEAGGSAYVYGISSGGVLALRAAARLPSIARLAVYEAPLIKDFIADERAPVPDDYTERMVQLAKEDRRDDMIDHFMINGVGMPPEQVAPMHDMPMWHGMKAIAPTLAYDATIMGDFREAGEIAEALRAIKVPTLVMSGGASPAAMQKAAQAITDDIPGAQHRTLEGQTHDVAPQAIAPALVEFFNA
jgi:pimeloyl-ACP methyl ester carboxylesterase